jgi:tripartite-type tricarboxylate transporter receptor subunit TctC
MKHVQRLLVLVLLIVAARIAPAAYPEQPIKVLMPFPPGSSVDVVTRLVCTEAGVLLGKPLVLDYRPGAAGVIASQAAARAPADGYTILITTPSHTINPALKKDLPFNTETDFVPVSLIATIPELLVAHPSVPFDTMDGFIKYAKANPGKLHYSSAGTGTLPHMTLEVLLRRAEVKVTHVPYKGGAPALTDLIAGVVQLKYDTYATASQHIASGKLKVLATAGRTRLSQLPNVPTVAESGFPGYEGYLWIGALAPRGVPPDVVAALSSALAKAVRMPMVAERLGAEGVEVVASTPDEFGRVIAQELRLWAKLVSDAKITALE